MFRALWRRGNPAVLLVSENPTTTLYENEFLRRSDLLTAFPDEAAVEIARRERPQLIVEDLQRPGKAGLAFCHDLADDAVTRSIPLILVAPEELERDARATHARVVLKKPLRRKEFFEAVRRFVPLPKRRMRRVSINLRFTYRCGDRQAQAFSRDLSSHGAFLKTDRILPLGTRLEVSFSVPGRDERVSCKAIVRGTSKTRGEQGGMGIEFEDLSETHRECLEDFLEQYGRRAPLLG